MAKVTIDIHQDPERLRVSENRRIYGSCKKLNDLTGWCPQIELKDTLQEILNSKLEELKTL